MSATDSLHPPEGMVLIPSGEFIMGVTCDETREDPDDPEIIHLGSSCPQQVICLSDYFIDIYPVTNRKYKEFIEDTGHHLPKPRGLPWDADLEKYAWDEETRSYPDGLDDYPVMLVSWYDALAYCDWAGKRLPTEAEWEKAARGTDGRPYPWGWDEDFRKYGHFLEPVPQEIGLGFEAVGHPVWNMAPVSAFPNGVSPYGCYDMLGNAGEWCADWFDEIYYAGMPDSDPKGPDSPGEVWGGPCRVIRGCSRFNSEPHVAERDLDNPWSKGCATGFRCALSL